ncbi:hypothetical protein GIB67_013056 [Kingdonia uniflora]|uniref:HAT C-terminal dimerisation domain-containing protein n=1 Tax=Kingdonia uniflora TaxID=39325 RepID=A0A7J7MCK4_9MAGN|nr:hypothetical protein GIB67_013056 [Kingdonia uniflora]
MPEYFDHAKTLADSLAASEHPLPEADVQQIILSGLDFAYDAIVASLTATVDDIMMDDFQAHLLAFGMRVEAQQAILTSQPLANSLHLGDWWAGYGYEVPVLQRAALRILSQPCSSYWCRWNWSTFESIHIKKRNRIQQEKFSDLVFVHCNLRLQAITQNRDRKCEPISIDEIDVSSEWPTESESSSLPLDDSWLDDLPFYYRDSCNKLIESLSEFCSWWWKGNDSNDGLVGRMLPLVVVALVVLWYTWMIFKLLSNKRIPVLPPGPRGLPLVGILPFLDPELHTYFAKLAQTYGPIFKLQLGNKLGVVVSSPSIAKEVLKDHDITFANHDVPATARVIAYGGSDIVWSPYGPEWRMLRKVCVREMLSNASLDAVYSLRHREVRRMVQDVYANIGSSVNVGEQMFTAVINVITSMLWGGTIKGDDGASLGAEFREVVNEITELLAKPNISDFYPALARFDLQGLQKQIKGMLLRFDRIFETIIEQRVKMGIEDGKGTKDFLQLMLQLKENGDGKTPFTMIHLKALLMDMVVGGTDTTSNSVEFAMAELINKPETMKEAQEELERVVGLDHMVEEFHIPKLQYLHAVMKEALRLHPALPLMVPHCPSSACTVGGYMIPKDTRVFVNVWAIHRDPSVWVNPLDFNPTRFLNEKRDFSGNDFTYFPFGSGRRICAGIPMAERMFMYELATMLHSFTWELPKGAKLDLEEKFGIVMKKARPLNAVPQARLSDSSLYA